MTETALVVGAILTILLFGIQVGIIGFLQTTADAASFMDARLAAVGTNSGNTAESATSAIFKQFNPARNELVSVVNPAPSPSVPVDYGYNAQDANEQAASPFNRHGGVSMMQPTLSTATAQKNGIFRLFGNSIGVASTSIDASWLECGLHENVANSNASCTNTGSSNYQGDYFKNGENPPPYFVSLDYLHHCNTAQPFPACNSYDGDFIALGTAAYLQSNNWGYISPGVGGAGGLVQTNTFEQMACHQRAFATVASFFDDYDTLAQIYSVFDSVANHPIYNELYKYPLLYPLQVAPTGFNSFTNFAGFTPTLKGIAADNAIQQIYSWDRIVTAGYALGAGTPGSYPLYPSKGCV